ncbi:MAG: AgmX/PglI C-terminal domain-containing protein [Polyangiaceae bacterium]|nr:AgmX/PglI C-terminal domain-containing protein [Polyangiaceae bacterium]
MGSVRLLLLSIATFLLACEGEGASGTGGPPREASDATSSALASAAAPRDLLQRHLQAQARAIATSSAAHANRHAPSPAAPIGDLNLELSLGDPPAATSAPRVRGAMPATGKLPPEAIQRVVRANFGLMRKCYDDALATQPNLKGRVTASFVIARDGTVGSSHVTGEISDETMLSCLNAVFWKLVFPVPDGGVVKVTYPISFTP